MRKFLASGWRFFATYWNTLLASLALVGYLVSEIYPPLRAHRDFYLFLGMTAIILTLVELKLGLENERWQDARKQPVTIFGTMREARPKIVSLLLAEVLRREPGEIVIVGGRIRSIVELLREFGDELDKTHAQSKTGCKISIWMMRSGFVKDLVLPGQVSNVEQLRRNEGIAVQMDAAVDELARACQSTAFRVNHVSIEAHYYDDVPFGYYYIIGSRHLVFGGYLWSEETADMIGPASPCWHLTYDALEFGVMRAWLKNRVSLYEAESTGKADLNPKNR